MERTELKMVNFVGFFIEAFFHLDLCTAFPFCNFESGFCFAVECYCLKCSVIIVGLHASYRCAKRSRLLYVDLVQEAG